jgi:hypothetical protein
VGELVDGRGEPLARLLDLALERAHVLGHAGKAINAGPATGTPGLLQLTCNSIAP